MAKGYLLILIGAIASATILFPLPFELMFWWSRMTFLGYLMISLGMRFIIGTDEELKRAQLFVFITLAIQMLLSFNIARTGMFSLALNILYVFSSLCIFFWLLKSEYMWSPNSSKKTDLTMYSVIAIMYLALRVMLMLPVSRIINLPLLLVLVDVLRFLNILYYGILLFILVKLYMVARKSLWN